MTSLLVYLHLCLILLSFYVYNSDGYLSTTPRAMRGLISHVQAVKRSVKPDRIRVQLLVDVPNLGKKGDIKLVSGSMWLNIMHPKQYAIRATDASVKQIETDRTAALLKKKNDEMELFGVIKSLPVLQTTRKVGPNNKMFGSVSTSQILEILYSKLSEKFIHILSIKNILKVVRCNEINTDGIEEIVEDIRNFDLHTVTLQLHQDSPFIQFQFQVLPST